MATKKRPTPAAPVDDEFEGHIMVAASATSPDDPPASPELLAAKEAARTGKNRAATTPKKRRQSESVLGAVLPPGVVQRGVAIPQRTEWFDLDSEAYPGLKFKCWMNCPRWLYWQVFGGESTREERSAGLARVVLEHNAWLVENELGELVELPPIASDGFWSTVPFEMATALMGRIREELTAMPNFLRKLSASSELPSTPEVTTA